tara:strand:- start:11237 stop:11890 length:654 start_codon:yes stop_codon:yes gene_type:complete
MILYNLPHSNFGAKIVTIMTVKGIADQVEIKEPPGGLRSETYRSVVPTGQIPALVDEDLMISESEAIAEYLNEVFPEPPLLPEDPKQRARARFLSRFHDLHLEPPIRGLFWQVPERKRDLAVVDEAFVAIQSQIDRLGMLAAPAPFLVGDRLSLADCGYPSTLMYLDMLAGVFGHEVRYAPHLRSWRKTLQAHPDVGAALAETEKAGMGWLPRKLAE